MKKGFDTQFATGVIFWAEEHPLKKNDVYENNAYDLKHKCEKYLGVYVSQDDIAKAYRSLGYRVERVTSKKYLDGYCWKIWDEANWKNKLT